MLPDVADRRRAAPSSGTSLLPPSTAWRRRPSRREPLTNDTHQQFEQVNRELGENREQIAKREGAVEGFLAGRRDRDTA